MEPDVLRLGYSDETYAKAMLGAPANRTSGEHKILGIPWNLDSDTLLFDVSELAHLAKSLQPTKGNLVSLIGKFYDPLGFLAPVTIKFNILFQKLCQTKLDWDNPLPGELIKEWKELVADLSEGGPISIPRSYFHDAEGFPTSTVLCGFCDASTRAYAAVVVVYLVARTDTQRAVRFVVAKTRVAPLQSQTVPRLELLLAFLLAKLIVSVANSLRHNFSQLRVQCYTDSQVALYWIRGTKKEWKPFIQNRVNEIRRNVHHNLWSHCPGISKTHSYGSFFESAVETRTRVVERGLCRTSYRIRN